MFKKHFYILTLILFLSLAAHSLMVGGVTWDEMLDFEGVDGAFWHAVNFLKGHSPDYKTITYDLEYYGNSTRWPPYLLWRLLNTIAWDNVASLPRHSVILASGYIGLSHASSIFYGFIASVLLYLLSGLLYPRVRYLSSGMLLLMPVWIGHSWFNAKDIPLATAYTLYTLIATIYIARSQGLSAIDRCSNTALLVIRSVAISLILGLRLGMAPFIVISELIFFFICRRSRVVQSSLISAFSLGLILALTLTPQAWGDPLSYIIDTFAHYKSFSEGGSLAGTFAYFAGHLWRTIPLFYLLGLLAVAQLIPSLMSGQRQILIWIPSALQLFLAPVLIVMGGRSLYNELRQVMFIYPMIVLFSAVGISRVYLQASALRPTLKPFILAPIGLVLALHLYTIFAIAPYHYLYASEQSRIINIVPPIARDYWGFSVRNLFDSCRKSQECGSALSGLSFSVSDSSWNSDLLLSFLNLYGYTTHQQDSASASPSIVLRLGPADPTCQAFHSLIRSPYIIGSSKQVVSSLAICDSH